MLVDTILAIYTLLHCVNRLGVSMSCTIFRSTRTLFTLISKRSFAKIQREYSTTQTTPQYTHHKNTTQHNTTQYHEHQPRSRTIQIPRQQSPNLRQPQRSHHLVHQSHRRGRNEPRLLQQPQCRSLKGQQPHTGLGRCRILHQSIQREGWSVV